MEVEGIWSLISYGWPCKMDDQRIGNMSTGNLIAQFLGSAQLLASRLLITIIIKWILGGCSVSAFVQIELYSGWEQVIFNCSTPDSLA